MRLKYGGPQGPRKKPKTPADLFTEEVYRELHIFVWVDGADVVSFTDFAAASAYQEQHGGIVHAQVPLRGPLPNQPPDGPALELQCMRYPEHNPIVRAVCRTCYDAKVPTNKTDLDCEECRSAQQWVDLNGRAQNAAIKLSSIKSLADRPNTAPVRPERPWLYADAIIDILDREDEK